MTCSACHAAVEPGLCGGPVRRFCGACGSRLVRPCPRCDFPAPVQDRYCGGCAAPLAAAAALSPEPPAASAPAPAPPPVGRTGGAPRLSLDDLAVLLPSAPALATAAPALSARVSQAELDALFEAAQ